MKNILVSLMSVGTMALAGWQMTGWAATSPNTAAPVSEFAASSQDIAGRWFSLPGGLMLQFNDDGSAQFGIDSDGTTLGYEAQTWFEGTHLFIKFIANVGLSDACANATGSYEVQLLDSGNLKFVDAQDKCQLRRDALQGAPDTQLPLEYSPVD